MQKQLILTSFFALGFSGVAMATDDLYHIEPGTYLPANSTTITDCPENSYCEGIEGNITYNETTAQGVKSCPDDFSQSATKSVSINNCYHECTTNDVPYSTDVISGNYYYNSTNQCSAAECQPGYHKKTNSDINLIDLIGKNTGTGYGYIKNNSVYAQNHGLTKEEYGLINNNTWATEYGDKGTLYGIGRCSTYGAENQKNDLIDDIAEDFNNGTYCWCGLSSYKQFDGTIQDISSAWIYTNNYTNARNCGLYCANICASTIKESGTYRVNLFSSVLTTGNTTSCEPNTITIYWQDADEEDINATNASTVIYGGDIRTPFKAKQKPGKKFIGWKFSKSEYMN